MDSDQGMAAEIFAEQFGKYSFFLLNLLLVFILRNIFIELFSTHLGNRK